MVRVDMAYRVMHYGRHHYQGGLALIPTLILLGLLFAFAGLGLLAFSRSRSQRREGLNLNTQALIIRGIPRHRPDTVRGDPYRLPEWRP